MHNRTMGKASNLSYQPRIILTRQRQRNKAWHLNLMQAGYEVFDLPLVCFSSLEVPAEYTNISYDWILFTSPQGVDAFLASGLGIRKAKLGALGHGTSLSLYNEGLPDDLGFHGLDGTQLAEAFVKKVTAPATVLLPGALKRMEDPRRTLEAAGFTVRELPLYETLPVSPREMEADFLPDDLLFFCSPSAVRAFVAAFSERPECVAIGETTAAVCRENNFPTKVAENPDLNAMVCAAGGQPLTNITENE